MEYRRIEKIKVDNTDYKYVVHDQLSWTEFVPQFLDVVKRHVTHIFTKRRQN